MIRAWNLNIQYLILSIITLLCIINKKWHLWSYLIFSITLYWKYECKSESYLPLISCVDVWKHRFPFSLIDSWPSYGNCRILRNPATHSRVRLTQEFYVTHYKMKSYERPVFVWVIVIDEKISITYNSPDITV